jgi:fatty acid desaturase
MARGLEDRIRALGRLEAGLRVREIVPFVVLAAWGALCVSRGGPCRTLGTVAIALAINAAVLLLHEGMHGTLAANRRINHWLSVALGGLVCMSFSAYQVLHLRHHAHLGDELDPDDYDNYTRSRAVVWTLHFVRLAAGSLVYLVMIPVLAMRWGDQAARRRIRAEYAILAAVYGAVATLVPAGAVVAYWGVPVLLVNWMTNVRGFTQHGITDAQDPYLASRSIHPHPIVESLVLHENLHLEHHLFPEVPSYRLADLHRLIAPRLPRAVTMPSYLSFLARFFAQSLTLDRTPIGRIG